MRQIFDRLNKFIKAEVNSSKFENRFHDSVNEDDELKKIISELENEKNAQKQKNESKSTSSKLTVDDAYAILDLNINATKDQIKVSYKKKIKEYHPDKVASLGDELQKLAQIKTLEINKAYEILEENGKV